MSLVRTTHLLRFKSSSPFTRFKWPTVTGPLTHHAFSLRETSSNSCRHHLLSPWQVHWTWGLPTPEGICIRVPTFFLIRCFYYMCQWRQHEPDTQLEGVLMSTDPSSNVDLVFQDLLSPCRSGKPVSVCVSLLFRWLVKHWFYTRACQSVAREEIQLFSQGFKTEREESQLL